MPGLGLRRVFFIAPQTQNNPSNIAFQVQLFRSERKADISLARRKAQNITRHSPKC
jgi:hypothetical protein